MIIYIYPERFDFMAKYLYIKYYEKKYKTDFFIDLYKQHINSFNGGKEEKDITIEKQNDKNGLDDFIINFNTLIDNMKKYGYDDKYPIPIAKDGLLENGVHRYSTSYYYKIKPVIKHFNGYGQIYDFTYFLYTTRFNKLDIKYADTMALEYVKHNPNLRCMVLYPNSYNKDKLKNLLSIIKQYGYIYYYKEINISVNGLVNLIKELYRDEEWIGGLFPIHGGDTKCRFCMGNNPTTYIAISMKDTNNLIEMKNKCRQIYGIGKHSLHISDYTKDTFRISSSLLNENSIHFLNNGTNNISNNTKKLLTDYFNKLGDDNEDYCLKNNITEELYNKNICTNLEVVDDHEIIYNPVNYFYFNGFKIQII